MRKRSAIVIATSAIAPLATASPPGDLIVVDADGSHPRTLEAEWL